MQAGNAYNQFDQQSPIAQSRHHDGFGGTYYGVQDNQRNNLIAEKRLPRCNLVSTDHRDNYRRSSIRMSKRSRPERESYLKAVTDHTIDLNETRWLNETGQSGETDSNLRSDNQHFNPITTDHKHYALRNQSSSQANVNKISAMAPFEVDAYNIDTTQKTLPSFKSSQRQYQKDHKRNATSVNNNNFPKQSYSYSDASFKPSPVLEHMLKDTRRRNRKFLLWMIYLVLMIICLSLMIYCLHYLSKNNWSVFSIIQSHLRQVNWRINIF